MRVHIYMCAESEQRTAIIPLSHTASSCARGQINFDSSQIYYFPTSVQRITWCDLKQFRQQYQRLTFPFLNNANREV